MASKRKSSAEDESAVAKKTNAAFDFLLTQFGGSSGGSAGDACLITLGDELLVVDFGTGEQRKNLIWALDRRRYTAVITHFHDDHCGDGACWSKADEIYLAPSSIMSQHKAVSEMKTATVVAKNGAVVWDKTSGNINVIVRFIHGYGGEHSQGENSHSGGVYGEVSRGGEVVFRWASLGDMVTEAGEKVAEVLGEAKLHYLKMPHHGCPNNHMEGLFATNVVAGTVIASSGYNSLSDEWAKIKRANGSLQKEMVFVLTHHPASNLGMVWEKNVKLNFSFKVAQEKT